MFETLPRSIRCAALAATCGWVAACGGGNDTGQPTVSSDPPTLVLRPGETDTLRATTDDPEYDIDVWIFDADPTLNWTLAPNPEPCAPPTAGCAQLSVGAPAGAEVLPANYLSYPSTHDDFSPTLQMQSWTPLVAFPAAPETAPPAIRFAGGGSGFGATSLAVDADGALWYWGGPRRHTTATDAHGNRAIPYRLPLAGGPDKVAAVAASNTERDDEPWLLILDDTGRVWTWGTFAPPIPPSPGPDAYPRAVEGLDNIIAVAAGNDHALALHADGTVWSWGSAVNGLLGRAGDGSQAARVEGLDQVRAIAAGAQHSLALRADGSVWAWGRNERGQLGHPTAYNLETPKRVEGIGAVDSIDAGWEFSLARRTDGTVWAWGSNADNQLGASSGTDCPDSSDGACSRVPLRVGQGLDGVIDVAAGGAFGLARRSDGSVWAWGNNELGQLGGLPGLGTLAPVQVPNLEPVIAIAAGARHALAMTSGEACNVGDGRTGGRLMAWGDNRYGERGDGTAVNSLRPTPVLTLGDDERCTSTLGRRLIVYRGGWHAGTLASSAAGLQCTGPICWQTVNDGATVALTAAPADAGVQPDWRWDCAEAGHGPSATLQMSAVRHCKLRFEAGEDTPPPPPESTITLSLAVNGPGSVLSEPAGIVCGEICSAEFAAGTSVVLTPSPLGDAVFAGFEGAADCTDGALTLDADTACTAVFEPAPTGEGFLLQVQRTGSAAGAGRVFVREPFSGIDCGSDCSERYPAGSIVFLQAAVEGADLHFSHWTGCSDLATDDEAGTTLCVVVMNADQAIEADFE